MENQMPHQNRVDPFGALIATPARGTLMGNRGCLHDNDGHLTARCWARKAWVTCALKFKDRHRQIMAPGKYTELFFLDEATAFAAGHRPCATCRKAAYTDFKEHWLTANEHLLQGRTPDIKVVDVIMHDERVNPNGEKQRWSTSLNELPDGTLVVLAPFTTPFLLYRGHLLAWCPKGYVSAREVTNDMQVEVLTPASVCRVFTSGCTPLIHQSSTQFFD